MIELLIFIPVAATLLSALILVLGLGFSLIWLDHRVHEYIVCRHTEIINKSTSEKCFEQLNTDILPKHSLLRFSVDSESLNRLRHLAYTKDPDMATDGRPYIILKLKSLDIKWQPEFQIKAVKAWYLD